MQQVRARDAPAAASATEGEAAGVQSRAPRPGAYTCLVSCPETGMGGRGGLAAGTAKGMVRYLDVETGQARASMLCWPAEQVLAHGHAFELASLMPACRLVVLQMMYLTLSGQKSLCRLLPLFQLAAHHLSRCPSRASACLKSNAATCAHTATGCWVGVMSQLPPPFPSRHGVHSRSGSSGRCALWVAGHLVEGPQCSCVLPQPRALHWVPAGHCIDSECLSRMSILLLKRWSQ